MPADRASPFDAWLDAFYVSYFRHRPVNATFIGMHSFGASAPAKDLMREFGFTPEKIAAAAKAQVSKWKAA